MSSDPHVHDPRSRRRLLRSFGAVGVGAVILGACGDDDEDKDSGSSGQQQTTTQSQGGSGRARVGKEDLAVLNFALGAEYIGTAFYKEVLDADLLEGDERRMAEEFARNEREHVALLTKMIKEFGGRPVEKPRTQFSLTSRDEIIETAVAIENIDAAAYLGAAPTIKDRRVLEAALAIHSVEARHAAAVNSLFGQPATEGPFAEPMDQTEVMEALTTYIADTGE